MTAGFLLVAAGILSFLGYRSTYWPLKFFAGLAWWSVAFIWLSNPPAILAAGSSTHVVVLLLFFIVGLAFMLMTFWGSKNENGTEVGTGFRMTLNRLSGRGDIERVSSRQARQNRAADYRSRVNRALGREE